MNINTKFTAERDGFKFTNSFVNDFVPALNVRTNGLCGGMSYSALDYFFTKTPVPVHPFQPANGTTLYNYLYDRQVTSILSNVDKWAEVGFNPLGARDSEFFNWGLSAKKGDRIDELKSFIDRGVPVVLGLQGDGSTGNHQVIAIGYDMGRYKGDLGSFKEDFKIFVCDPNHPEVVRTLIPDVSNKIYHFDEGGSDTWRTYFVDKNYHVKTPPVIKNGHFPNDGLTHELVLAFHTGVDDLRGGNDNVNLIVNLMDGTQQSFNNINLGARWVHDCDQNAEVVLSRPVDASQIRRVVVSTTFTGGIDGDNWDMTSLDIHTWGSGGYNKIKSVGPKRFTHDSGTLSLPVTIAAPTVHKVQITKAQMLTSAYLSAYIQENYPAYGKFIGAIGAALSGGKVTFDLRVKITDSEGHFLQGVTSNNVKVETYKKGPPISGFAQAGPSYILLQTVKAPTVVANPPTDYHVQAIAKPASAVVVIVEKGGESVRSEMFYNIVEKE